MERKYKNRYLYLIIVILVIILVIPFAIRKMNDAVIDNVQMAGDESAHVYALNEASVLNEYEVILETLEYQLRPENRTEDYSYLIGRYLDFVMDIRDLGEVEAYAVIDGKIHAATYWEGDETFDVYSTEWYQRAIEADGEIIYTNVYTDARLREKVVTLAMKIQGTDDVVAVDMYPMSGMREARTAGTPEGTNYYLCDSAGTLLFSSVTEAEHDVLQDKFNNVFRAVISGENETDTNTAGSEKSAVNYITGIDGQRRGVYYYQLDSGWYAVVTIPYQVLVEPYLGAWQIFVGVIVVFMLTVIIFAIIDFRTNRKAKIYNEIIGVLGNSYYALYQVDLTRGEYYMMKGSDYVRNNIPRRGDYAQLVNIMEEVIYRQDYGEFSRTFSTKNMQELVRKRVRDFGGDFRRLFNGEYRWVHVQMLYDESLQKGTVVLAFRDVNEAKKQDLSRLEFLKNSLESVDRMTKSKNMFFSQMSHDMRTPLNGIIGLTRIAEGQVNDPEKMADTLKKVRQLGSQLLELINEILDISRIEEGKLELKSESFMMKENLEELTAIYQPQMEEKGKIFTADLDIADVCVVGDWGKIQQILNNLLSNAMKFTGSDGIITLSVNETVDSNSKYRKYCFTVRDNGAGMSRDFLSRLFIPFEREVQFGAAKVAGTGLGMPIVHELVQKMGGTIEVDSELGKGTVFEVTIPFRISEETAGPERIEEKGSGVSPQEEGEDILKGRRVLLAEDNAINMEIAAEMLGMFGLDVIQAWNGKEAYELFVKNEPRWFDIILMDMQMPVMDGCEAAEMIRKSGKPDAADIPIIAVTANAFAEDIALTKKAGMNAHISKPIDFRMLKETMKKLLDAKRAE